MPRDSDRREKQASTPWWICGGKLAMGGWQYVDHLGDDGHVHPVHATCLTAERNARDDVLRERYGTDALGCTSRVWRDTRDLLLCSEPMQRRLIVPKPPRGA